MRLRTLCGRSLASTVVLVLALATLPRSHAQTYTVLLSLPSGSNNGSPVGISNLGPTGHPGYVGVTPAGGFVGSGTLFTLSTSGDYTLLWQFDGYTGYNPDEGPASVFANNPNYDYYYGTTQGGENGGGAIWAYSIANPSLNEIYNFCSQSGCSDGEFPSSGLAAADGFWGTTSHGGEFGLGTVYRLEGGRYEVEHSFAGASDGALPGQDFLAIETSCGAVPCVVNLYGTTTAGGTYGLGTVFQMRPCLSLPCPTTILHSFGGTGDVWQANGVTLQVGTGSAHSYLYGVTAHGGSYGYGTIFQYDLTAGEYQLLYSFTGGADGSGPVHNVLYGPGGILYGTALQGGGSGGGNGYGTLWQLSGTTLTVLHTFCSSPGCADGSFPGYIFLPWDAPGDIVGSTSGGGTNSAGAIFQYAP